MSVPVAESDPYIACARRPTVTREFELFDEAAFAAAKHDYALRAKARGILNWQDQEGPGASTADSTDANGERTKFIANSGTGKEGAQVTIQAPGSCFQLLKVYRKGGSLEQKGWIVDSTFIGIHYYFDANGKLVREDNTDASYPFSFDQVLAWMKEQGIPVYAKFPYVTRPTEFSREVAGGRAVWYVSWAKTESDIAHHTLDGKSGKVLATSYSRIERN